MIKKVHRGPLFLFILSGFLFFGFQSGGQEPERLHDDREGWVDSVMSTMDDDARIGQLFMVAAYTNRGKSHVREIEVAIKRYQIGGLIFFQDNAQKQVELTNHYQELSKVPLLIGFDGEWGLDMRLKNTQAFPRQMTLGAIQDDQLIYDMGAAIARQCKRVGIHVNFAPVIDVNSNPLNPVIGMRSFGEDKERVTAKGKAYMKGMQDHRVMACGKHFPGHGDTDMDSHLSLPVIQHSRERLDSLELYPFKELIQDSLGSIMVAHIHVPAYDSTKNRATTLSSAVVHGLLKRDLGFKGLVFTDALNMKGVSGYYDPGETDVLALKAGNDVLLFPMDVSKGVSMIRRAVKEGEISMEDINQRVRKILEAKYWAGLHRWKPLEKESVMEDLHRIEDEMLINRLYESAMTVPSDPQGLLPLRPKYGDTLLCVSVFSGQSNVVQRFEDMVSFYAIADYERLQKTRVNAQGLGILRSKINKANTIVIGWYGVDRKTRDAEQLKTLRNFLSTIPKEKRVIFVHFGIPYAIKDLRGPHAILMAYQHNVHAARAAGNALFGGKPISGTLPVTINEELKVGTGDQHQARDILTLEEPEATGLSRTILQEIDTIAEEAISMNATPGCQVLVAHRGKIVFEGNYGQFTYSGRSKFVEPSSVYDVASISKVAGTLQAVMLLAERGEMHLDSTIETYLPEMKGTNKEGMIIREIIAHQAGLFPYLEHWRKTVEKGGKLDTTYYRSKQVPGMFDWQVAEGIYSSKVVYDSIWKWTIASPLIKKNRRTGHYPYRYSDVGFYMMKEVVERLTGLPLNEFMEQNFYEPLNLPTMTYRPLEKYTAENIAPTEDDRFFRNQLVQGYVHDPGSAMLGGVAGHAGIFSNARDLATLMQMLLNGGTYDGRRYFQEATIADFTAKQFPNSRRGAGWDKPEIDGRGPTGEFCSPGTYGHSGFTGTCVWVDPDYDLIYVFLSNRVYPDAMNTKLLSADIRTRIQDVVYKALLEHSDPNHQ